MADTNNFQQILDELLLTVSATAVIVMRVNDPAIKIMVGELSPTGFNDLAEALERYWPASLTRRVIRYASIAIDDRFQVLYVESLPDEEHWLGLLFPHKTPFRRIRQDMAGLIEALMANVGFESDISQRLECFLQHSTHPSLGSSQESLSGQSQEGWIRINDLVEEAEDEQVSEIMFQSTENIPEEVYQVSQTLNSSNSIVDDVAFLHSNNDSWLGGDVEKIPFREQMFEKSRILPSLTRTRITTDIRQSHSGRISEKDRRSGSPCASNKEGASQNK